MEKKNLLLPLRILFLTTLSYSKYFSLVALRLLFLTTLSYWKCFSLDAGSASPDFMIVHTPKNKENARIRKKRKCLFDEKIVLSNEYAYLEF